MTLQNSMHFRSTRALETAESMRSDQHDYAKHEVHTVVRLVGSGKLGILKRRLEIPVRSALGRLPPGRGCRERRPTLLRRTSNTQLPGWTPYLVSMS